MQHEPEVRLRMATASGIVVSKDHGGVLMQFSDKPLDALWQTRTQARDLILKLVSATDSCW